MGEVSRRALLAFGVASAASAGCARLGSPPPIQWVRTIEEADALTHHPPMARWPLFVVVGARWDSASKELETVTFKDPAVRAMVTEHYIPVSIDISDEGPVYEQAQRRFGLQGTPLIVVYAPQFARELVRINEFIMPGKLLAKLRGTT